MESLGQTLKKIRESVSLTLRQVEETIGISNAYLSQLENNKIKKPSANVLYKLANLYKVDLNLLLSAAGIIEESFETDDSQNNSKWMNKMAFYFDKLSDEEKQEIISYAKFKANKKNF